MACLKLYVTCDHIEYVAHIRVMDNDACHVVGPSICTLYFIGLYISEWREKRTTLDEHRPR